MHSTDSVMLRGVRKGSSGIMSLQFNREISLPMALTNYSSMCMEMEAHTVVTMKIPVS